MDSPFSLGSLLEQLVQFLEDSFAVSFVLVGKFAIYFEILDLQVIELFHPSAAHEQAIFLPLESLILLFLQFTVELHKGITSTDVLVVEIIFRVDLILQRPLLMQGDILQVYIGQDRIALIHNLDLLTFSAIFQQLMRISDKARPLFFNLAFELFLFRFLTAVMLLLIHVINY